MMKARQYISRDVKKHFLMKGLIPMGRDAVF